MQSTALVDIPDDIHPSGPSSSNLNGRALPLPPSPAGNILDNIELLDTLDNAKAKAVEIGEKLAEAKITAEEIEVTRVKYTPVARRGATLFFVLAGLSVITNMYEYSLGSFLTVFNTTLKTSKKDPHLESR